MVDKRKENIFEIPVSATAQFKIGQKVDLTIYPNTTADIRYLGLQIHEI